jgi:hypothetical protein
VPQLDVPLATQVAFAESATPPGTVSATVTLSASESPVFATVTVYVAVPPGVWSRSPSVLVAASVTFVGERRCRCRRSGPVGTSVAVAVLTSGIRRHAGRERDR